MRAMRRQDRAIQDPEELKAVLDRCKVCRVGMVEEGKPYIVPLNFGYTLEGEELTLWFHSARQGRKLDILRQNPQVCFEMDCGHALTGEGEEACVYSYAFSSIMGEGITELPEDPEQKLEGLRHLMEQVAGAGDYTFDPKVVQHTVVLRLRVQWYTGKRHE